MEFILKGLEFLASAIARLVALADGLIRLGAVLATFVLPLFENYEENAPQVLTDFGRWGDNGASEVRFG